MKRVEVASSSLAGFVQELIGPGPAEKLLTERRTSRSRAARRRAGHPDQLEHGPSRPGLEGGPS